MSPDHKLLLRALMITVIFAIIGGGMLFMIMESDIIFSAAVTNAASQLITDTNKTMTGLN